MNVVLPPDLQKYVDSLVQTGRYDESCDVIEEALRQHRVGQGSLDIVMTPRLEKLLDEGMQDLEHAKTTDEIRRRTR